ncbi:hypothetical protein [Rhizobium sp. GN54]|uniref:hypothetical protein n=1 Tax=Rhizobium sp. GN54 TaxID=2898150 RepID=UPI001E38E1FD|nr:hypothetical protein [Rhizobium sp. GN54]MCD2181585.1 hypothetical protein [Rhizobium sp. GN54]
MPKDPCVDVGFVSTMGIWREACARLTVVNDLLTFWAGAAQIADAAGARPAELRPAGADEWQTTGAKGQRTGGFAGAGT